jgi:Flp pilus assembly protein CpaB
MQADFSAERRRRRIIIVIAVVLGLVATIGTYALISRPGGGGTPQAQTRTIVVAAKDIPARTQITADMLQTATVTDNPAFASAINEPALAIGALALVDIKAGEPMLSGLFATSNGKVAILAPGETVAPDSPVWRAISVSVPDDRAVGGFIQIGDHVDLIATVSIQVYDETGALANVPVPSSGFLSGNSTKITLLDLEVLQINAALNVYVLRVDENQAEQVAYIQTSGGSNSFTLSLRPQADTRDLDRNLYGETINRIQEQYGFPIPQGLLVPGVIPTPVPSITAGPSAAVSPSPSGGAPSLTPSATP